MSTQASDRQTEHRFFVLENGIRVVLFRDPEVHAAFAQLAHGLGSLDAPGAFPDLPHLLEHVQCGTRAGASEPSFYEYVQAHNGHANAQVGSTYTHYWLLVSEAHLDAALPLLAQVALPPDPDDATLLREMRTLVSEEAHRQWDSARRLRELLSRQTSTDPAAASPYRIAWPEGPGALDEVRSALVALHRDFVCTDDMVLCLASPRPLDASEALVRAALGSIPPSVRRTEPPTLPELPGGTEIRVAGRDEDPALQLVFPLKAGDAGQWSQAALLALFHAPLADPLHDAIRERRAGSGRWSRSTAGAHLLPLARGLDALAIRAPLRLDSHLGDPAPDEVDEALALTLAYIASLQELASSGSGLPTLDALSVPAEETHVVALCNSTSMRVLEGGWGPSVLLGDIPNADPQGLARLVHDLDLSKVIVIRAEREIARPDGELSTRETWARGPIALDRARPTEGPRILPRLEGAAWPKSGGALAVHVNAAPAPVAVHRLHLPDAAPARLAAVLVRPGDPSARAQQNALAWSAISELANHALSGSADGFRASGGKHSVAWIGILPADASSEEVSRVVHRQLRAIAELDPSPQHLDQAVERVLRRARQGPRKDALELLAADLDRWLEDELESVGIDEVRACLDWLRSGASLHVLLSGTSDREASELLAALQAEPAALPLTDPAPQAPQEIRLERPLRRASRQECDDSAVHLFYPIGDPETLAAALLLATALARPLYNRFRQGTNGGYVLTMRPAAREGTLGVEIQAQSAWRTPTELVDDIDQALASLRPTVESLADADLATAEALGFLLDGKMEQRFASIIAPPDTGLRLATLGHVLDATPKRLLDVFDRLFGSGPAPRLEALAEGLRHRTAGDLPPAERPPWTACLAALAAARPDHIDFLADYVESNEEFWHRDILIAHLVEVAERTDPATIPHRLRAAGMCYRLARLEDAYRLVQPVGATCVDKAENATPEGFWVLHLLYDLTFAMRRFDEATRWSDQMMSMAADRDDLTTVQRLYALYARIQLLERDGRTREAQALRLEQVALAEADLDHDFESYAHVVFGLGRSLEREPSTAADHTLRALEHAKRLGHTQTAEDLSIGAGVLLRNAGRYEEALPLSAEHNRAVVLAALGRFDEARPLAEAALGTAQAGDEAWTPVWRRAGHALCELGQHGDHAPMDRVIEELVAILGPDATRVQVARRLARDAARHAPASQTETTAKAAPGGAAP